MSNENDVQKIKYTSRDGRQKNIKDHYLVRPKQIGLPGTFGSVYYSIRKIDRRPCAVKIISKKRYHSLLDADKYFMELQVEYNLLKSSKHSSIIELYDIFDGPSNLMLVMELCCGGDLFDRIYKNTHHGIHSNEHWAAKIIKQVLKAVEFLHDRDIMHGDLKPTNIMFSSPNHLTVKVIDFGFAQKAPRWLRYLRKEVGTLEYSAPELLCLTYNKESDL